MVGFGKAATEMAATLCDSLADLPLGGAVVTKYGHALAQLPRAIQVFEAGHPLPDAAGVAATEEILRLIGAANARTLVVVLVSGGGSALLVAPQDGLTLEDKQRTTSLLLGSGADIVALNTVRKHLSRAKGGRLAQAARPASMVALILSDVINDPLDVIASGPTAADPTTYADALSVLDRFQLAGRVPAPVIDLLCRGQRGELPETPKPTDPCLTSVENLVIGSNRLALEAAAEAAAQRGLAVTVGEGRLSGEAREVGRALARLAVAAARQGVPPSGRCLISGGETTVTVRGRGRGGRNLELALAFAIEAAGHPGITLLSAGTDGTDGPTGAAGAVVTDSTLARVKTLGLDPLAYLDDNDSYTFFARLGDLVVTGPTGTNVMDLQIVQLAADR